MREYIVNLTDNLIANNQFDILSDKFRGVEELGNHGAFIRHVQLELMAGDVRKMNPTTLGKIMCQFEIGDVMLSRKQIFENVTFGGDCEDFLREIVAFCLAAVIRDRLDYSDRRERSIPPFKRAGQAIINNRVVNRKDFLRQADKNSVRRTTEDLCGN